jgi:hypothetical protein
MVTHSSKTIARPTALPAAAFYLVLALALSAGVPRAPAQCYCEPYANTPLPDPQGPFEWGFYTQIGDGTEGRIAIVVSASLLPEIEEAISTFADDLVDEGHRVVVVWITNARPADLRGFLQDLYADPTSSLSGAVLVGDRPPDPPDPNYTPQPPWILVGDATKNWPADAYYMDLDGVFHDTAHPGYYTWEWSAAEIWVSRIKVDGLSDIPQTEAEIANAYFERNHALRTQPGLFSSDQRGLVYQGSDDVGNPPGAQQDLASAFGVVDMLRKVTPPEMDLRSKEDYLARMRRVADRYSFVVELSHGWHDWHEIRGERLYGWEYLRENQDPDDPPPPWPSPTVFGVVLSCCRSCDFGQTEAPTLGAEVAFGPYANALDAHGSTLVVVGYGGDHQSMSYSHLWTAVGIGECFGEAYKAQFDATHGVDGQLVFFGDGSLKADTFDWVGSLGTPEDPQSWRIAENWEGQIRVPWPSDRVRISGASVLLDHVAGTPYLPAQVWSIALHEGANLDLQGGEQPAGLELGGSLIARPHSSPSVLTLDPGSKLELPNLAAHLAGVQIVLPNSDGDRTRLFVGAVDPAQEKPVNGGFIEDVSHFVVGENCRVSAGMIDGATVDPADPIRGELWATTITHSALTLSATARSKRRRALPVRRSTSPRAQ